MIITQQLSTFYRLRKRLLFLLVMFLCASTGANAQLSGTYTIDPAGTGSSNFTTFKKAVDSLTAVGVSGAVTFEVADGTYNEKISIGAITGASSTNRITFQSASEDSTKVILTQASSTTSTANYTLQLNGADYITFRDMTIERPGTNSYGRVIHVSGGAHHNQFLNNRLISSITTSTNAAVVYSAGDNDTGNIFNNNLLRYGYYGFYWYGNATASTESGTIITGNTIDSAYYYGINFNKQHAGIVTHNKIINLRNTSTYGLYIYENSGTSTDRGLIANNMVSVSGTSTTYGIYLYYSNNQDIVYNSILNTGTSLTSGRGLYVTAGASGYSGNLIYNNIFANTGGGYAVEMTANGLKSVTDMDYNDLYVTGTKLAAIGSTDYTTLAAWQTASGFDTNSVSVDPRFTSNTNLHARAILLNAAAKPLSNVTTDFDRQTRSTTTPDIGADEFSPPTDDAAVTALVSPAKGSCAGTKDVTVTVRNAGIDTLKSVRITYLLNGVQQTSKVYTVSIASAKDTNIVVGTVAISTTNQNIVVYTSDPNTNPDPTTTNDTLKAPVQVLSGTYTIGGTGADYPTFNAAISAMEARGICGAVTFNVANGTYNEAVTINQIAGASATNRITIQSASGDSSKVILTNASSASTTDNFTLQLKGADFVTVRKITIERSGSGSYGRAVEINTGAHNNRFLNNRIIASKGTSTNSAGINSAADNDTANVFTENLIMFGYYGISLSGDAQTNTEAGTVIHNNIIDSAYYYGIRLEYQHAATATNNSVINLRNTSNYGIYIYYNTGTTSRRGLFANNMFSVGGTSTSYGINLYYSSYQDVVYNSVLNTGTSATASRAFYATAGATGYSDNRIYNNSFVKLNGFTAVEVTANGIKSIADMDYNNIYSTGAILAAYGTTDYKTLPDWQTASGWDTNSVSVDPMYISNTDLHTKSLALNNAAMPFASVTTDFDFQTRSTTTPDIGADEFTPPVNDIAVIGIISPVSGSCGDSTDLIGVVVQNFGTASQRNFDILAKISGAGTGNIIDTFTATIASAGIDTFYFSRPLNTYSGGTFNLQVYSDLTGEENLANDTFASSVNINAIPAKPTVKAAERCGAGSVTLSAKGQAGQSIFWYASPTSTTALKTDSTFSPSLTQTTTYYVESRLFVPNNITTTFAGGTTTFTGNFFDIKANKSTSIDSFDIHTTATGSITVDVYYKTGTYAGSEKTSSAWTKLGTSTVTGQGSGKPTTIKPGQLTLSPNQVYGVYIIITSGGNIAYTSNANTYSNADLTLETGAGINGLFTGSLVSPRTWNGTVYYSVAGCPSPRVPVTATIKPLPSGSGISKGSVFEGKFNAGTANNPDSVCAGNTVTYELITPKGFSNADFNKTWAISALSFETVNGTNAQDTLLTAPSSAGNGKLSFTPRASLADSTFILSVTLVNMANSCDTTITRFVHVSSVPEADFSATTVCDSDMVTFTDASTGSGTLTYLYKLGDGNTSTTQNPIHTYATAGSYQVTLIVMNAAGCMDSVTKTVVVNARPVADFTAENVCQDSAVTFTNNTTIASGTLTYAWDFGDGNSSTDENPAHTFATAGTYNVKLVATSNNGCKDSITTAVTVYPKPAAGFTSADVCIGETTSFSNTSTVANGTLTYLWTFGDGDSSTLENPTHTFATAGAYNVILTVTSATGCVDSISKVINVNERPIAAFQTSNVCFGLPAMFMNMSQDSTTQLTYSWRFGDGGTSTDRNPTHLFAAAGTYTVSLNVTTASGCEDSISSTVTVYENPVAGFAFTDSVCAGSAVNFSNNSNTLADTAARYLWIFANGDTSTSINAAYTFNTAGNYNVVLLVANGNGCVDSVSHNITIIGLPTANFGAAEVCIGQATTFIDSSSVSNGSIVSRVWYFGDGDSSTMMNPQHTYTTAGSFTASLVVTTSAGCTDSVATQVVVNALPDAAFTKTVNQRTVTFTPAVTNLASYKWTFGDGDSSVTASPVHTYDSNGTYFITLTVTNAAGCTQTFTDSVVINTIGFEDVTASNFSINVYPNPFREQVNLTYELERSAQVHVAVYDITGKQVATLVNGQQGAGKHIQTMDGNNYNMPAGTYFIRLNVDGKVMTNKIIRVK